MVHIKPSEKEAAVKGRQVGWKAVWHHAWEPRLGFVDMASPLPSRVAWRKVPNLPKPQFPHLDNEDTNSTYFTGPQ